MEAHKHLVKVLVPVYKPVLSDEEKCALQQMYKVLNKYPLVVIKPESLDLSFLTETYPLLTFHSFEDACFEGIAAYNRLMLSEQFYASFSDTRYILIYQLDAYVFRDELAQWCDKGYDYIGAPWLKKPLYDRPLVSGMMKCIRRYDQRRGKPNKQMLYNKVGNGGLSLRKVESHYRATRQYGEQIDYFLKQKRSHLFNEDVFWATVPDFSYPEAKEALRFSFDKYPKYCYRLNNNRLPFGCHSWYKRKMKRFWASIIQK
jgi:hypothetical protein